MPQGLLVCPLIVHSLNLVSIPQTPLKHCLNVDPLPSYPTLEQLSQLECDQWLQLGVCLGLGNDHLETKEEPTSHSSNSPGSQSQEH